MGQNFFTKSILKPYGPGALSEGKLLTTASISLILKHLQIISSPDLVSPCGRSKLGAFAYLNDRVWRHMHE